MMQIFYYDALQNYSIEWHNDKSNYTSFVKYCLEVVSKGYNEVQDRIVHLRYRKSTKEDRVKTVFDKKLGVVKKSDIATLCPDISETTIERILKDFLEIGFIEKVGKGRATEYAKK